MKHYPKLIRQLLKTQTIKDSSVTFSGHIASALINAVFFALAARLLQPTLFGIFSLSMATAYLIKDFADLALDSAVMRFTSGHKNLAKAKSFLKHIFSLKIYYLLAALLTSLIFFKPLSQLIFKQNLYLLIPLTFIWAASQSLLSFVFVVLQAKMRFISASLYISGVSLIRLILFLALIPLGLISIPAIIIVSIASDIITSFIGFSQIKLNFLKSKPSSKVKQKTMKFALPLVPSSISGTLSDKLNLYITNYFSTTAQVGVLAATTKLFTPVQSLAGSLSRVFGSRFSSFDSKKTAILYLKKSLSLTALLASGLIFSALLAKPLILIFYGNQYLQGVPVFQILTVGFAFFLLQVPLSSFTLYFLSRSDYVASISIVQLITTIVFNIALIPAYGLLGAAFAFLAVMIINFALYSLVSQLGQPASKR